MVSEVVKQGLEILYQVAWVGYLIKCQVTVPQDEEADLSVASSDEVHPLVTDEHIKHFVHHPSQHHGFTELGLQHQYWVPFVDLDEPELAQESEGCHADLFLSHRLQELHFTGNEYFVRCHAVLTGHRVHAKVTVFQTVALLFVFDRILPR